MSRKSVLGDDFHRKSLPKTSTIVFSTQKKSGQKDVKGSVGPYVFHIFSPIFPSKLGWREAREELFREVTKDGAKSVEARDPTNIPNFFSEVGEDFSKFLTIFEDFWRFLKIFDVKICDDFWIWKILASIILVT